MQSTIPRVDIEALQKDLMGAREQLIKDAQTKLGYRKSRPLLEEMAKLGIAPFRPGSLKAYKQSMETESMRTGTRDWLIWTTVNVFLTVGLVWGYSHYNYSGDLHWPQTITIIMTVFGGVSFLGSIILSRELIGTGERTRKLWQECDIESYLEAIPDHVLNKALQIKDAMPQVGIRVSYLCSVTDKFQRPLPDPFLVVYLNKESYTVEQWNEKDLPRLEL